MKKAKVMALARVCSRFCWFKNRKKRNKIDRHSITCSYIWHLYILVLLRYTISESLMEIHSDMNGRQKCMKIPRNAIKS